MTQGTEAEQVFTYRTFLAGLAVVLSAIVPGIFFVRGEPTFGAFLSLAPICALLWFLFAKITITKSEIVRVSFIGTTRRIPLDDVVQQKRVGSGMINVWAKSGVITYTWYIARFGELNDTIDAITARNSKANL